MSQSVDHEIRKIRDLWLPVKGQAPTQLDIVVTIEFCYHNNSHGDSNHHGLTIVQNVVGLDAWRRAFLAKVRPG